MAAELLKQLFDADPITVRKLERITLDLGVRSGRCNQHVLRSMFNQLFQFPEFTLEKLVRLIESRILEDSWLDGFLMAAFKNQRDAAMIEYLKGLSVQYTHFHSQLVGREFSEGTFILYENHFPVPGDIIFRITGVDLDEYKRQVQFLMDRGYKLNLIADGETVLTQLISFYYNQPLKISQIQILVELGANVNQPNADGNTPLHLAYHRQLSNTVEFLLAHSADPEISNNYGTTANDIRSYMETHTTLNNRLREIQKESARLKEQLEELQKPRF